MHVVGWYSTVTVENQRQTIWPGTDVMVRTVMCYSVARGESTAESVV